MRSIVGLYLLVSLPSARTLLVAAATFVFCATSLAQSFQRDIPYDAKRATIRYVENMTVALNGTPMRLAPGAHIRDRNNFIVVPSSLPQEGALAEFMVDRDGNVSRVWLLTAEETVRTKRKPPAQ